MSHPRLLAPLVSLPPQSPEHAVSPPRSGSRGDALAGPSFVFREGLVPQQHRLPLTLPPPAAGRPARGRRSAPSGRGRFVLPGEERRPVRGWRLRCPSLLLPPPGPASPSQPGSHSIPQGLCPRQRGHSRLCCSRRSLLQRGGNSCPPLYKMESPSPVIRAEQPHVTNQTTASVAGAIKWQKRKRQTVKLVPPKHPRRWGKEEGALGARNQRQ